jgi:hypothetical protein
MTPKKHKTPRGLKEKGLETWRLSEVYDFSDCPEKLLLLEEAARTADIIDRLQKIVDETKDLRVRGSAGQPVGIPELDSLRAYKASYQAALRGLNFPSEDEESGGGDRRPMSRTQVARLAARARWGT